MPSRYFSVVAGSRILRGVETVAVKGGRLDLFNQYPGQIMTFPDQETLLGYVGAGAALVWQDGPSPIPGVAWHFAVEGGVIGRQLAPDADLCGIKVADVAVTLAAALDHLARPADPHARTVAARAAAALWHEAIRRYVRFSASEEPFAALSFVVHVGRRVVLGCTTQATGKLVLHGRRIHENAMFSTEGLLLQHFGEGARVTWQGCLAPTQGASSYAAAGGREIEALRDSPDADLGGETMADVVVTLAAALDRLAWPDGHDNSETALVVGALWRAARQRGIFLA